MSSKPTLAERLKERFGGEFEFTEALGEVTLNVPPGKLHQLCLTLRDEAGFEFGQLTDICGVDYSAYGQGESSPRVPWQRERFAAVYHLLSVTNNVRIRLKAWVDGEPPMLDSVTDIWSAANWYEREVFDLIGIVFDGHPDLRRILTDYGFIGHPFRKDFPLSGHVEMRYDPEQARVVYQPVSIEPRINVPRVIRDDFRYEGEGQATDGAPSNA